MVCSIALFPQPFSIAPSILSLNQPTSCGHSMLNISYLLLFPSLFYTLFPFNHHCHSSHTSFFVSLLTLLNDLVYPITTSVPSLCLPLVLNETRCLPVLPPRPHYSKRRGAIPPPRLLRSCPRPVCTSISHPFPFPPPFSPLLAIPPAPLEQVPLSP